MDGASELEIIPPDGAATPPSPTPRPRATVVLAVAALAGAVAVTAVVWPGPGPSRLDRVATAVEAAGRFNVRWTVTEHRRYDQPTGLEGLPPDVPRRKQSGAIDVIDGLGRLLTGHEPGSEVLFQTIATDVALYDRAVPLGGDLRADKWTYHRRHQDGPGEVTAEERADRQLAPASPISGWGPTTTTAELARVLRAVGETQEGSDGLIRGRLTLKDLFGTDTLTALGDGATGGATVEVTTTGPRLDRLVWHFEASGPGQSHLAPDSQRLLRLRIDADLTFSDWGTTGFALPGREDIDPTPGIDEAALAVDHGIEVLAPTNLPDGYLLTGGGFADAPNFLDAGYGSCPLVALTWYENPERGLGVRNGGLFSLRSFSASCGQDFPTERDVPLVAGRFVGAVYGGDAESPERRYAHGIAGATRIEVETTLPHADLERLLTSLAPFDLTSQRIYQSLPPS